MKKQDLTKEALISLWNRVCKNSDEKEQFSIIGTDESPYYLMRINESLLTTISATPKSKGEDSYEYKINVVFGEYIEYISFNLDKSEFDSLVNLFIEQQNKIISREIENIIKKTEQKLFDIISEGEI